ncbi:SH3 domain-containing protein [Rhizobium tumorigenes]|uniref:SH3 domain-containing protein n=1 Tax=Rhizobium tumorigenes TaxID=2041385 RepID=UPI00241E1FF4|nr:SH3 domain-containing protein [Rhizobium tumorigenes]WFS02670.1 SH3 domain-containing protein [Rhizobium tumorigenes]
MSRSLVAVAGFSAIVLLVSPLSQPLPSAAPLLSGGSAGTPAPVLAPGFARGSESGLAMPRFVSLKPRKARLRIGPSLDYATRFIYVAPGLPLEVIQEYGRWRQVRDSDGTSGWMYGSLLSGQRTGIVGPWLSANVPLRVAANAKATAIAVLQPKVLLRLSACDGSWCRVHLSGLRLTGYIRQAAIWGAYPGEVFG